MSTESEAYLKRSIMPFTRIYFLNLLTLLLIKSGAGATFQQNFPLAIFIEQHKNVDEKRSPNTTFVRQCKHH